MLAVKNKTLVVGIPKVITPTEKTRYLSMQKLFLDDKVLFCVLFVCFIHVCNN
jgi:hypothetical protein